MLVPGIRQIQGGSDSCENFILLLTTATGNANISTRDAN